MTLACNDTLGDLNLLAHCYCSGSVLAASSYIAETPVELDRVGAGPEYDELVAFPRDLFLGYADQSGADALACGRRQNVETFDRVTGSM